MSYLVSLRKEKDWQLKREETESDTERELKKRDDISLLFSYYYCLIVSSFM